MPISDIKWCCIKRKQYSTVNERPHVFIYNYIDKCQFPGNLINEEIGNKFSLFVDKKHVWKWLLLIDCSLKKLTNSPSSEKKNHKKKQPKSFFNKKW